MQIALTPFSAFLILFGLITFVMAMYFIVNYGRSAAPLFVLLFGISFWITSYGIALCWFGLPGRLFWTQMQYLGFGLTFMGLVTFGLSIAGYSRLLTKSGYAVLSVMPLLTFVLAWTNSLHHWVWTSILPFTLHGLSLLHVSYGPFMVFDTAYNYIVVGAVFVLLVRNFNGTSTDNKRQAGLFITAISLTFISNLATLIGLNPFPGLDLTPLGFMVSIFLILLAVSGLGGFHRFGIPRDRVVQDMPDAFFVLDTLGRVIDINPAGLALLGRHRDGLHRDDVLGQTLPQEDDQLTHLLMDASTTGDVKKPVRLDTPAGVRYYNLSITPLADGARNTLGRSVVLRDITEQTLGELALRSTKEQVEDLNQRLIQQMAQLETTQQQLLEQHKQLAILDEREKLGRHLHDGIGQALGSMNVVMQTAHFQLQGGHPEQAVETIDQVTRMAAAAHDDLRAYILGLQPANHSGSFEQTLRTVISNLGQAGKPALVLEYPEDTQPFPFDAATEAAVLDVLREAVGNIRKHAGAEQAVIRFAFKDEQCQVTIIDDGHGFDAGAPAPDGHFGLGIMRARAEEAGGSLQIDSQPEQGTTLRLRVPTTTQGNDNGEDLRAARGLRLLLVDDHPLFLDGLRNLLQAYGLKVIGTARDGAMALAMARELKPDIVVLDLNMPNMDGFEATRQIKAALPQAHILVLTVSEDEENLFEAVRNGASGYLLKSLSAQNFISTLAGISRGETPLSTQMAVRTLRAIKPSSLSQRQWEILTSVANGNLYKEVAHRMHISERTVKREMGLVLEALHVAGKNEAVAYAKSRIKTGK